MNFKISRRLLFVWILFLSATLIAQSIEYSLGFQSRLGRGDQIGIPYDYSESYLDLQASAKNWTLMTQLEWSQPPEYGRELIGIHRFSVERFKGSALFQLGHLAHIFGSGMSLNLYEDQNINLDNMPLGLKLSFRTKNDALITALVGRKDNFQYYAPGSNSRVPDGDVSYDIAGIELEKSLFDGAIGFQPRLVWSNFKSDIQHLSLNTPGQLIQNQIRQQMMTWDMGVSSGFYGLNWDIKMDASYQMKLADVPFLNQEIHFDAHVASIVNTSLDQNFSGKSVYSRFSWYPDWMTASLEYKYYGLNQTSPNDRIDVYRLGLQPLPFQVGPTVIRQHELALLASVTHPVDYADEMGFYGEIIIPMQNFILSMDATIASWTTNWSNEFYQDSRYFPSLHSTYQPFWELHSEFDYSGDSFTSKSGIALTESALNGIDVAEITRHFTLVPTYFSWHFNDTYSIGGLMEYQNSSVFSLPFETDIRSHGHDYESYHFIASVDIMSKYSLAYISDFSSDPALYQGDRTEGFQSWNSVDVSSRTLENLSIRMSYGSEKGGVRCTGGVCRLINPFEGFRMIMEYRL